MNNRPIRRMARALLCAAVVVAGTATGGAGSAPGPVIRVVSNRADLISGGDAMIEIDLPGAIDPSLASVFAGEQDVTGAFAPRPNGRYQGLVTGLEVGETELTVRLADGSGARITLTNHPIGGPVFAGPQTTPWICNTIGQGLDEPLNEQCDVAARSAFYYRSTDPSERSFQAFNPESPPSDVAMTTTDRGETVPFVIRVETGVMDRGIYSVGVLYDPGTPWEAWAPQDGWNGKVIWPFGGDCKPWHQQDGPIDVSGGFPLDPDVPVNVGVDEALGAIFGNGNAREGLARGFMVATSSNNKLGSQCNTVVSAESIMMLKEHIVETYGPIRYTIGAGGSGGAMQQQQIATSYPGLLDGIQPAGSFPDVWEAVQQAEDCHLLNHYFDSVSPHLWAAAAQQNAVTGYPSNAGCRAQWDGPHGYGTPAVGNYAGMWLDPDNVSGCGLPAAEVYSATNPTGVRCTLPDYMSSIFGLRPDGFANRPYDNVGVQYGLRALESGTITPEQFVDLNAKIGGLDIDWNVQAERSAADPDAVEVAYRAGLVNDGRGMATVPTIDIRGHDNYEIHADFHSYVMRARLDRSNGHHDNQVIFTGARAQVGDPTSFNVAFDLIDEWLARVDADDSALPLEEKVRRHRPARAVDSCWFEGQQVTDQGICRAAFPYFGDPRIAAGGPLTDDVVACGLKPLERADYPVGLNDDQWARLQQAFPTGVCDYTVPGPGQQPSIPWLTFAGGPGGRPLGPAPVSIPIL